MTSTGRKLQCGLLGSLAGLFVLLLIYAALIRLLLLPRIRREAERQYRAASVV